MWAHGLKQSSVGLIVSRHESKSSMPSIVVLERALVGHGQDKSKSLGGHGQERGHPGMGKGEEQRRGEMAHGLKKSCVGLIVSRHESKSSMPSIVVLERALVGHGQDKSKSLGGHGQERGHPRMGKGEEQRMGSNE
jgi:hypothetical protein